MIMQCLMGTSIWSVVWDMYTISFFTTGLAATVKIKLCKIFPDAVPLICENCFCVMLENANPQKSGARRYVHMPCIYYQLQKGCFSLSVGQ